MSLKDCDLNLANPTGHIMRRVHCLGRGQSFGEMALMSNGTRKARIIGLTTVHMMTINRECFQKCLQK